MIHENMDKSLSDREQYIIEDEYDSPFLLCIHCCRAYNRGDYKTVGKEELQLCPYDGCDGDTIMDAWSWGKVREDNPDFPEIPEIDFVYDIYKAKK